MENISKLPGSGILDFYNTEESLDSDILAITQSSDVGAEEEDFIRVRVYNPELGKSERKLFARSEFVLYSQLILKTAKEKKDSHNKQVRIRAYQQMEVRLTDIVEPYLLNQAIEFDATKLKRRFDFSEENVNTDATIILRKFIPTELMRVYKKYPEAFKKAPGFLYPYEFIQNNEPPEIFFAKITPNLPMFLAPNFEIEALKTGTISRTFYLKEHLWYYANDKKRYDARIKRMTKKLMTRTITYNELLSIKPELFEFIYNQLNTKKLIQ